MGRLSEKTQKAIKRIAERFFFGNNRGTDLKLTGYGGQRQAPRDAGGSRKGCTTAISRRTSTSHWRTPRVCRVAGQRTSEKAPRRLPGGNRPRHANSRLETFHAATEAQQQVFRALSDYCQHIKERCRMASHHRQRPRRDGKTHLLLGAARKAIGATSPSDTSTPKLIRFRDRIGNKEAPSETELINGLSNRTFSFWTIDPTARRAIELSGAVVLHLHRGALQRGQSNMGFNERRHHGRGGAPNRGGDRRPMERRRLDSGFRLA